MSQPSLVSFFTEAYKAHNTIYGLYKPLSGELFVGVAVPHPHTDLDAGRTQRFVTECIAFTYLFNNRTFRLIAVLDSLNRFMHIGVERFAHRWHRIEPFVAHHLIHLPVEHTQYLLQRLKIHAILIDQTAFYIVHYFKQSIKQGLFLVLYAVRDQAFLALAHVLQVGAFAQELIPVVCCFLTSTCQLCLQFSDTSCILRRRSRIRSLCLISVQRWLRLFCGVHSLFC